jgi:mannan endo-1,4-beta-mannosidase
MKPVLVCLLIVSFSGCVKDPTSQVRLADADANRETRLFYHNLRNMQGQALLFGHQATLNYGYRWTEADLDPGELRSDVKDVTGSFPSVYGFAVNAVADLTWTDEQREAAVAKQLAWDRGIHERGGVITYEWHMFHPASGKSFYDTSAVVHRIIPGGDLHHVLKASLDQAADYFNRLAPIPVIYRPWHEHNGDWFWWCKGSTSEEDFIALWRFTVDYLKNEKQVHNVIYAYSPDRSRIDIGDFETGYLWGYPGDDYVDLMGLDNYWDLGHPANTATVEQQLSDFRRSLEYTVRLADNRGKIAALTEAGLEAIPHPTWWTDVVLSSILHNEFTKRMLYVLVWRNANRERENRDHYYAPYPGQVSADDFVRFRNHPYVRFEDELPDLYGRN